MDWIDWELVKVSAPPFEWIQLEDSTWDALISALAGERNVLRQLRSGRGIKADDQEIIDSTIDEHLAAAKIPHRPRGYDWFLRPPPGLPNLPALHKNLNEYIGAKNPRASHPRELRELVEAGLRLLYS
ncbi:DUF5956 family protein [Arthrobacter sp. ISL-72]|uniref:DUF5956 family protein n=1 Tax=Arthrobacter sp. ISL-72 TaxID=2819114 RepID=UPI001BE7C70F|nr:DUF5956 family protein [Arthrobacter sp. ISL-72]MBT2597517.1 hypothetical protein [Arthrobacter sp. ISL-72]